MQLSLIADQLVLSLQQECPGLKYDYSLAAIKNRLEHDLQTALEPLLAERWEQPTNG